MPITIPLSNTTDFQAIVDTRDAWVLKFRWSSANGYVQAWIPKLKNQCYLHRLILDAQPGDEIRHKNKIRWDCRRRNLQVTTCGQNPNRKRASTTGIPGIGFRPECWRLTFHDAEKRHRYIGTYPSEAEARQAQKKHPQSHVCHCREFYRVHTKGNGRYLGCCPTLREAKTLQKTGQRKRTRIAPRIDPIARGPVAPQIDPRAILERKG